jgi:hypothetical protein
MIDSVRFISEDTYKGNLWNPQSLNRYTYVENNPLKYIDPSGFMKDYFGAELPMPTGNENGASQIAQAQANWFMAQDYIDSIKAGKSTGLLCFNCDKVETWENYQKSMSAWADKIRSGKKYAQSISVKLEGQANLLVGAKLGVEVKGHQVKVYFTPGVSGAIGATGGAMLNYSLTDDLNNNMSSVTTNAGISGGEILIGEFTYKSDQKYVELGGGLGVGGGINLDVIPVGGSFEKEYTIYNHDIPFNTTNIITVYPAYNGAPSAAEWNSMLSGNGF